MSGRGLQCMETGRKAVIENGTLLEVMYNHFVLVNCFLNSLACSNANTGDDLNAKSIYSNTTSSYLGDRH